MSSMRFSNRQIAILVAGIVFASMIILVALVVPAFGVSGISFLDDFNYLDPARWHTADWTNPLPPFWNRWRPDHVEIVDGQLRIRLDNTPCPSGCSGRPYASGEVRSNEFYGYGRFETDGDELAGVGLEKSGQQPAERYPLGLQAIQLPLRPGPALLPQPEGLELVGRDDHGDAPALALQNHRAVGQGSLVERDSLCGLRFVDGDRAHHAPVVRV